MVDRKSGAGMGGIARFLGWQETRKGPVPLFNVVAGAAGFERSTVFAETLRQMGIAVPSYPTYEEWKAAREKQS